jgi:small conductance mechanosensitive channel
MEKIDTMQDKVMLFFTTYGPTILGAIIVFIIGLWVINFVVKITRRSLSKRGIDVSLQSFLISLVSVGLKILLIITVAGMIGIQTTSFVAVIGALGLAIGLALQGSLANFAGGVLMLFFKPFKVGDLIESQGQTGVVQEIQIFNTILLTPENKTVILANGAVSNGTIINYNKHGNLRVDMTIAVAPDNDVEKVKQIIMMVLSANNKILKEPAPFVGVSKVGDGMVTIAVRPYSSVDHYWDVFFGVQEEIKKAFDQNRVAAPVPTRVVLNKN